MVKWIYFDLQVAANQTRAEINKLSPLTWYEVSVVSENRHGTSLPSYRMRVLTLPQDTSISQPVHPVLPDIVKCCEDKGVQHDR